jgi:hypothetical protein
MYDRRARVRACPIILRPITRSSHVIIIFFLYLSLIPSSSTNGSLFLYTPAYLPTDQTNWSGAFHSLFRATCVGPQVTERSVTRNNYRFSVVLPIRGAPDVSSCQVRSSFGIRSRTCVDFWSFIIITSASARWNQSQSVRITYNTCPPKISSFLISFLVTQSLMFNASWSLISRYI